MGNTITFTSRPRFKIKNQTEFPIFVKLTLEKIQGLEVENLQPGKRGSVWRSVRPIAEKLGSTLEKALADTDDMQRNRVVLDICPESSGFKEISPGDSYKSHKMWAKLEGSGGKGFLTVLTREFLWEDLRKEKGGRRIDENPVNANSYNVPFHNAKQEGLHKEIIVARLGGKLEHFCR